MILNYVVDVLHSAQVSRVLVQWHVQFGRVVDVPNSAHAPRLIALWPFLFDGAHGIAVSVQVAGLRFSLLFARDPVPDASLSDQEFRWHA